MAAATTNPAAAAPVAPKVDPRKEVASRIVQKNAASVGTVQEVGGLVGRLLLALLVAYLSSRPAVVRIFQVPGLILVPLVFFFPARNDLDLFRWGAFLAGLLTVAQFSFWGNYLPRVYPLHLRGTGESFAANIGGRMIGTSFALLTTTLASSNLIPGSPGPQLLAYTAAIVGAFVGSIRSSVRFTEANIVSMVGTFPANKCSRSTRLDMESTWFETIDSTSPEVASRSPIMGT